MLCDEGNTYMLYVFIEILDCTQYRKPPVMPVLHISNFWAIGYELGRVGHDKGLFIYVFPIVR